MEMSLFSAMIVKKNSRVVTDWNNTKNECIHKYHHITIAALEKHHGVLEKLEWEQN